MIKKLKKPKYKLVGERIVLRRVKPTVKNAVALFSTIDENREFLGEWLDWVDGTKRLEDSLKYLFETEKETEGRKKVEYAIYIDEEYAGHISFFNVSMKNKSAEMGYWLAEKFCGEGYMSEAIRIFEKEFFKRFGMNRLVLRCDELNRKSIAVAKRNYYKLEGRHKEEVYDKKTKSFRNGLTFAKLKSNFREK